MALGASVKGISIQFEADTTKLGTALRTIDSQAKGLDKNLRQVNNALKFNPGNTELVAQKQKLLGDKINSTKQKLEQLKKAQATLDDDPAVDKTSEDYMELQREIITTESKLKHFEGEMKKLNNIKFQQVGEQFKQVGGKMQSVGRGLTTSVTAPIVGIGAASLKAFKDVDEGLDIVTQKTGATGKPLKAMQDSVKRLATTIPTDFATAGAAVGEVNTRFGVTGKNLEKLSAKFIKFAELNGTDVSTSVDSVQKAMKAFGVPTKKAGMMLDTLNKVGQNTGISMEDLSGSLVKNAPALKGMGLNANKSATFLGQLEKSGADSSKVLTGLQKALVNGAKAGKSMPEVMREIQTSIVGAKSDTEAMNKAAELFGAKAGPAIATAARSGALDFTTLGKAATKSAGSVDKTFEDTLDPIDKFKTTLNSAKIAGAEIGNSLMTVLGPALNNLAKGLQSLAKWWEGLSPAMQNVIVKVALFAAAVGPILVAVGKLLVGIGTLVTVLPQLKTAFTAVGGAFKGIGALMSANPFVLIIAGIVALVAAFVILWKRSEKFRNFWKGLWKGIKTAATGVWDGIKSTFAKVWGGITKAASAAWKGIKAAVLTPLKLIVAGIKLYVKIYQTIFVGAWKLIKAAVTAVWNGIKTAATAAWNGIKTAIIGPINAAKTAVTNAYNAMKKKVSEKVSAAASWVTGVRDKISNAIKKANENVRLGIDFMKKKVGEKVSASESWTTFKNKVSSAMSNAKENVKTGWNYIKSLLGGKITLSKSLINIGSTIKGLIEGAKRQARNLWNAIKGVFKDAIKLKVKLPKLTVTWGKKKKGKVSLPWPSFGISWNKDGAIFKKPTIFDTRNGLQGLGENGAEAVLPIDRLFTEMNQMFVGMADSIVSGISVALAAASSGQGGDITIPIYLYPSGPKMGEETVKMYDMYKKRLG